MRVACFVASAEGSDEPREKCEKEFYRIIRNMDFLPGGRILANSGRPQAQLLNCFVVGIKDSRESIGQAIKDYLVISGTGGGVGLSFREIRYRGAPIVKAGGLSSGSVSFMDVIDAVASTVKTGGGRRAATMLSLPVDHPDIMEFLSHKLDRDKLNNANVSVEISEKFLDAVRRNGKWNLVWAGKTIREIQAREVWDILVKNALECGEPGLLNFELMEKTSNSAYFSKLSCTNPCGEIPLSEYGVCCLGSINVNNFINEDGNLDRMRLREVASSAIRFLDNTLAVNSYPLPQTKDVATNERRIGLGLMGVHTAMLRSGISYGSRRGISFIERCYEELRDASYLASSELAAEKGSFPKYDCEPYLEGGFTKTLPANIRHSIYKNGMRNVCVNTQAPTGTTSLLAGVSSGIEPIFAPVFQRTFYSEESATGRKQEVVLDVEVERALRAGMPIEEMGHFQGAYDIEPRRHFQAQEAAQRYVDNAVSKTLNLPEGFDGEQLSALMLEYAPYLKGTTVYRAGSREFEPLQPLEFTEENVERALRAKDLGVEEPVEMAEKQLELTEELARVECPSGTCDL
jgi:ribonucleoside-diphosphate reductase alpha chain